MVCLCVSMLSKYLWSNNCSNDVDDLLWVEDDPVLELCVIEVGQKAKLVELRAHAKHTIVLSHPTPLCNLIECFV